jgi:glycosyltransferase involved in cell wall biosynthesis
VVVSPYPTAGQRHAGPSGVASYAANLCHALSDHGAAVEVVAPHEADAPDEPPLSLDGPVSVRRAFTRGPRALVTAASEAAAARAPVVHLQHELFLYGGPPAIPGVVPALLGLRRHTRPVVTLHQVVDPATVDRSFTELHRVRVPPLLARHSLHGVQRSVAALSRACIVHEEPFAAAVPGSVVIPHGVEQRVTPDRDEARAALGLDERLVVLCFGFVAPYKGLEAVLTAGALIGPRCVVVVAGGPHPRLAAGGDDYATDLEQRYAGPGARFTGWVPEADVARWFAAADAAVFAYPAPFSSSGALALAFAHRTPVLLSPALAECVGAPTAMTAPHEPHHLAARLASLLDPRERARLAAACEPFVERRSWSAVAAAHLHLYEQVAA